MKILITAGPTWVKIDEVRILTSIFTGYSGLYLAKRFAKKGHAVTLFINPHCLGQKIKGLRVIPFKYFEDFTAKIIKELKGNSYDAIIHSAAVSDYKLKGVFSGKIPSGKKNLSLQLIPTEKIVKVIRRLAKRSLLVQFKLEVKRKGLFKEAQKSLKENKSDFVVANALEDLRLGHKVFLIDGHEKAVTLGSKRELFSALQKIIQGLEYQMRPIFFQASPPKAAGRRKNVRLNLTPTPILKKRVGGKEFGLLKNRRLF